MVGWQLCSNASYPFPAAGFSLPPPGPVHLSLRLLKLDRGLHHYLLEAAYSLLAQVRGNTKIYFHLCDYSLFALRISVRDLHGHNMLSVVLKALQSMTADLCVCSFYPVSQWLTALSQLIFHREAPGCPERPPSTSSWPHLSPPSPGTCLWTWTSTLTGCCSGLPILWKPSLYKVGHRGTPEQKHQLLFGFKCWKLAFFSQGNLCKRGIWSQGSWSCWLMGFIIISW